MSAGHAQIEKDLFEKQRPPELYFCGRLIAVLFKCKSITLVNSSTQEAAVRLIHNRTS